MRPAGVRWQWGIVTETPNSVISSHRKYGNLALEISPQCSNERSFAMSLITDADIEARPAELAPILILQREGPGFRVDRRLRGTADMISTMIAAGVFTGAAPCVEREMQVMADIIMEDAIEMGTIITAKYPSAWPKAIALASACGSLFLGGAEMIAYGGSFRLGAASLAFATIVGVWASFIR